MTKQWCMLFLNRYKLSNKLILSEFCVTEKEIHENLRYKLIFDIICLVTEHKWVLCGVSVRFNYSFNDKVVYGIYVDTKRHKNIVKCVIVSILSRLSMITITTNHVRLTWYPHYALYLIDFDTFISPGHFMIITCQYWRHKRTLKYRCYSN